MRRPADPCFRLGHWGAFKDELLQAHGRAYFEELMRLTGGNKMMAGRLAGMERKNLIRELRRYGVAPPPGVPSLPAVEYAEATANAQE
jgi:hypothetical protein